MRLTCSSSIRSRLAIRHAWQIIITVSCWVFQAASVVLNVFLLGAVSGAAWARFGVWIAATLVVFLFYGLPSSYLHSRSRCHSPIYAAEAAELSTACKLRQCSARKESHSPVSVGPTSGMPETRLVLQIQDIARRCH